MRATFAGDDFPNGASGTRANASGGAADVRQASAARKDKSLSRGSSDFDRNVMPQVPFAGSSRRHGFISTSVSYTHLTLPTKAYV